MSDLLLVSCVHFDQSLKHEQPIAFGVSCNLNLQSQSPWSLFNGTWQKRPIILRSRGMAPLVQPIAFGVSFNHNL